MAMSCDYIYATETSTFGQPEVNLGLIPCFGGCVRLMRYIGSARAKELIYSGKSVTAQQAFYLGLVNEVFATQNEMLNAAVSSLETISLKSYESIAICKSVMNKSFADLELRALENEKIGFRQVFETEGKNIGIAQFLDKKAR